MWHYVHHLMFDPLSWWDRTKRDLIITGVIVGFCSLLYVALAAYEYFDRWSRRRGK